MSARDRARSILKRCRFHKIYIDESISTISSLEFFLLDLGFKDNLGVCLIDKKMGYKKDNIMLSDMKTWARGRNDDHGTSKYKGVGWYKNLNKWRARIKVNGRHKHLGYFESEEDACKEYNLNAVHYFGTLAKLNDINRGI